MAISLENLKTSFAKADADKDGTLNFAELGQALAELKLELNEGKIKSYLDVVNPTHKGAIDQSEFVLLVRFLESPAKSVDGVLSAIAWLNWAIHNLAKDGGLIYCPDSHAKVHITDADPTKKELESELGLFAGFWQGSEFIQKTLGKNPQAPLAIIFNVHCKNGAAIKDEIAGKLGELKELLSEMSNEAKQILSQTSWTCDDTPNGVQIIIDLSQVEFLAAWLETIKKPMSELAALNSSFAWVSQTSGNLADLSAPFAQLSKDWVDFKVDVKNVSAKNLLKIPEFKAAFKHQLQSPDLIALCSLFLAIKKFEFVLQADHKIKVDILTLLGVDTKTVPLGGLLDLGSKKIEETGGYDYLDMFDSGREIMRILHNNGAEKTGLFIKLFDDYLGAELKIAAWPAMNKLLKLEQ